MTLRVVAVDGEGTGQAWEVGQRVRIHPASDWFMRGATHGIITSLGTVWARVKLEHIGPAKLRAKIRYDLLTKASL